MLGVFNSHHYVETEVSAKLLTFEKENTLFTSFAIIDLVDTKKGYLKREAIKRFFTNDPPTATVGYCKKTYEIGIGYRNIQDIIKDALKKEKISKDILPEPEIISINPISSEVRGKYPQMECDQIDKDTINRLIKIKNKLNVGWEEIVDNSKQILLTFIQLITSATI